MVLSSIKIWLEEELSSAIIPLYFLIRIWFVRQTSAPTLEQTNKQTNQSNNKLYKDPKEIALSSIKIWLEEELSSAIQIFDIRFANIFGAT